MHETAHTATECTAAPTIRAMTKRQYHERNCDRPDDCDCSPTMADLPCWPCWRAGFKQPNPDAQSD